MSGRSCKSFLNKQRVTKKIKNSKINPKFFLLQQRLVLNSRKKWDLMAQLKVKKEIMEKLTIERSTKLSCALLKTLAQSLKSKDGHTLV
jgi:hypothetical protein